MKRWNRIGFVYAVAMASVASAEVWWSGASATNNWTNSANWLWLDRPDNDWSDWVYFDSAGLRFSPNVNQNYNIKGIEFDDFYGSAAQYSIVGSGTLGMTGGIGNEMSSAQGVFTPIRLDGNAWFWNYDSDSQTHNGLLIVGGSVAMNFKTLGIEPSNNNITLSATLSGSGDLLVDGPGKVIISGANSFTGDISVRNGTVEYSFGSNLGSLSSRLFLNAQTTNGTATIRRTTTGVMAIPVFIGGLGGTLATPAGTTLTLAQGVGALVDSTAASSLHKTEAGTAVLQGTLGYTGSTVVRAGTLRVESTLPRTPVVVDAGGTLDLVGGVHIVSSVTSGGTINLGNGAELATGLEVFTAGGGIDISGTITGLTGRLTKRGTDTAYLRSANTYGGGTVLGGGTTIVSNTIDSATGSGPVTLINPNATLAGNGRIAGPITANDRTIIRPGNPTGDLRTASVNLLAGSTLASRIEGTEQPMIGRLNSTGTVSVAGAKLALELPNNYRPSLGQSFEIVRATSITGVFSSVEGMPIAGVTDRRLAVVYVDSTTDLVRVIAARPGDANLDQTVGFADLLVVAQNYESPGVRTWATGDFDGNGNTNFSDLLTLAQFYSSPQTLQSDWATARALVPEPTMLSLLLASGLLMARRR